jgi:hypothetical protein
VFRDVLIPTPKTNVKPHVECSWREVNDLEKIFFRAVNKIEKNSKRPQATDLVALECLLKNPEPEVIGKWTLGFDANGDTVMKDCFLTGPVSAKFSAKLICISQKPVVTEQFSIAFKVTQPSAGAFYLWQSTDSGN